MNVRLSKYVSFNLLLPHMFIYIYLGLFSLTACLLKFETKTDFYNMVFNAQSENVLLFSGIFLKKVITI